MFTFSLCACSAPAHADASPKTPLRAEIAGISEHRGSPGRCQLTLKITDDRLLNVMSVLRARATRAVDDTGQDMMLPPRLDQANTGSGVNSGMTLAPIRGWYDLHPTKTRFASLQLTNSARRATMIAELEGEAQLFAPTLQNGGVIIIERFRRHPGQPLTHPTLRKLGISLTFLTKAAYEVARAEARRTAKEKLFDPSERHADALFPGILNGPDQDQESAGTSYVVLKVHDPEQRVAGFAFLEPGGRLLPVTQRRSADSFFGFYFNTLAPPDLALYVYLAVPEALESLPFKLQNIPLP